MNRCSHTWDVLAAILHGINPDKEFEVNDDNGRDGRLTEAKILLLNATSEEVVVATEEIRGQIRRGFFDFNMWRVVGLNVNETVDGQQIWFRYSKERQAGDLDPARDFLIAEVALAVVVEAGRLEPLQGPSLVSRSRSNSLETNAGSLGEIAAAPSVPVVSDGGVAVATVAAAAVAIAATFAAAAPLAAAVAVAAAFANASTRGETATAPLPAPPTIAHRRIYNPQLSYEKNMEFLDKYVREAIIKESLKGEACPVCKDNDNKTWRDFVLCAAGHPTCRSCVDATPVNEEGNKWCTVCRGPY